ncbi:D-alanyl-D-alanine carboxypeptidase family protein [Dactylosporangium sp. CA-139114]|uniref:D-alanyl-D-alanine carboxypeptidase family protein n=1 Tax=Dactylosporangium sp. CA-139114 TaxID=3239931 RepID=UPI003D9824E8
MPYTLADGGAATARRRDVVYRRVTRALAVALVPVAWLVTPHRCARTARERAPLAARERALAPARDRAELGSRAGTLGPARDRADLASRPGTLGPARDRDDLGSGPRTLGPARDRADLASRAGALGPARDRADLASRAGALGPARHRACQWALAARFPAENLAGLTGATRAAFEAARAEALWRHGELIGLTSGYRDPVEQARLFAAAVARDGSVAAAWRRVLPPHASRHVAGTALDVRPTEGARWLERHGDRHGLYRTYDNEWWHFEYRPDGRPVRLPHPGVPEPHLRHATAPDPHRPEPHPHHTTAPDPRRPEPHPHHTTAPDPHRPEPHPHHTPAPDPHRPEPHRPCGRLDSRACMSAAIRR